MRINGTKMEPIERKDGQVLRTPSTEKPSQGEVVVAPALRQRLEHASQNETAKAERLSALRTKIKDGSYKVDFEKLAERLLSEELPPAGAAQGENNER